MDWYLILFVASLLVRSQPVLAHQSLLKVRPSLVFVIVPFGVRKQGERLSMIPFVRYMTISTRSNGILKLRVFSNKNSVK